MGQQVLQGQLHTLEFEQIFQLSQGNLKEALVGELKALGYKLQNLLTHFFSLLSCGCCHSVFCVRAKAPGVNNLTDFPAAAQAKPGHFWRLQSILCIIQITNTAMAWFHF